MRDLAPDIFRQRLLIDEKAAAEFTRNFLGVTGELASQSL